LTPDTDLNSRSLAFSVLILCVTLSTLVFVRTAETNPTQNFGMPGYCMAEQGGTVYFSAIYDIGLKGVGSFSSRVISREFSEYLTGRYNPATPRAFPSNCPFFTRMTDAEASRRQFQTKARQEGKQVVDVDWKYVVDPEYVAALKAGTVEDVTQVVALKRKPTHTYCLSSSDQGTLYTAGPVETGQAVNLSLWYRGFNEHLSQKYAFKGQFDCNIGSLVEVKRLMDARIAGARAASKKVIDTGWKYDASATATNNPRPAARDDDPEPVQRPVAPNPSRKASDEAMKETPIAKEYCQKDTALSAVFICDSFARAIYNYRMAHQGEAPESMASLIAGNKLRCPECIDNTRVGFWVENRATADGLTPKAKNCATQKVIVALHQQQQPSRLKEFYQQAVAACK
jgi:hypothetical protein